MTSEDRAAVRHYETLLAPIYAWMVGDPEAARARARDEIRSLGPFPADAVAVDLGAGLGHHARALVELGHRTVWMVDTNAELLATADAEVGPGPHALAVTGDLTAFDEHVEPALVDTIVCMGDTLTHLADRAEVELLLGKVARALRPGGVFTTTFRDHTRERRGADRFVPVRSDDRRILTVFLEYGDEVVQVHDLLWERDGTTWSQRVSTYPKLRLDPGWVADVLRDRDLDVEVGDGVGGQVQITARRRVG